MYVILKQKQELFHMQCSEAALLLVTPLTAKYG